MKKNVRRKDAEWEYIGGDSIDVYRCSRCHCFALEETSYCPKCKSYMKGGAE